VNEKKKKPFLSLDVFGESQDLVMRSSSGKEVTADVFVVIDKATGVHYLRTGTRLTPRLKADGSLFVEDEF